MKNGDLDGCFGWCLLISIGVILMGAMIAIGWFFGE